MSSARKRKLEEESSTTKLTKKEKLEKRAKARAMFESGFFDSKPTAATATAAATPPRAPKQQQQEEPSPDEQPPKKRVRHSMGAAATGSSAATNKPTASKTDTLTKAELKARRQKKREELQAKCKAGIDPLGSLPAPAAAAPPSPPPSPVAVPAAAASLQPSARAAPAPPPPPVAAAATTKPVAPPPMAAPAVFARNTRPGRRLSFPFNSPPPVPTATASPEQVATGPRMPDFMMPGNDDDDNDNNNKGLQQREPIVAPQPAQEPNDKDERSYASSQDADDDEEEDEVLVVEGPPQQREQQQPVPQEILEDETAYEEAASRKQGTSYYSVVLVVLGLVGVGLGWLWSNNSADRATGSAAVVSSAYSLANFFAADASKACFATNVQVSSAEDDNDKVPIAAACADVEQSTWQPCPENCICAGGVIQECLDEHFVLENNVCVLSQASKDAITGMVDLLEEWTRNSICYNGNAQRLFALEDVLEKSPGMDWPLMQMTFEELLVWEQREDSRFVVGLPESHAISLPGTCHTKNVLRFVLEGIWNAIMFVFGLVLAFFVSSCSVYWSLFKEIPLVTTVFTIVVPTIGGGILVVLRRRQNEREERRRLELDRAQVRQEVYKILSEAAAATSSTNDANNGGGSSQHYQPIMLLRDRILFDVNLPYHASKKDRDRLLHKVWPRVVADIAKDNRVAKGRQMVNGVSRECWKWADHTHRVQ